MKIKNKQGDINPIFRWSGGKQRFVNTLLQRLPPEEKIDQYYEPFLGGGALFLASKYEFAFLNDINPSLINAFEWVKLNAVGLHQVLHQYCIELEIEGESYYYQLRDQYNRKGKRLDLEDAACFIFLMLNNFNGIYRVNKKGLYNVSFGHRKFPRIPTLQHLMLVQMKLANVPFSCQDFEAALQSAGKNSFVYLDPPSARNLTHRYSLELFDKAAHQRLADCANDLSQRGAKVMITIADTELTRELYGLGWLATRINIKRKLHGKTPSYVEGELILTNYDPQSKSS